MRGMSAFRFRDAMSSAKSNAEYFGRPYVVFVDTNGNWRSQSYGRPTQCCFHVVWPDGHVESSSVETDSGTLLARRENAKT